MTGCANISDRCGVSVCLFQRHVGQLVPIRGRCGTACDYLRQMWGQCVRISESCVESLRLFEADVGMVAPMSGRCGVTVRLFETDVGSMCAYFREMWDSLCLFDLSLIHI